MMLFHCCPELIYDSLICTLFLYRSNQAAWSGSMTFRTCHLFWAGSFAPKERPGVNKTGFIKDLESWRHDQNVDNESSIFDLYFLKYKNPSSFNFLSLNHEIILIPSGSLEWATKFMKTTLVSIRIQIQYDWFMLEYSDLYASSFWHLFFSVYYHHSKI